MDREGYVVAAMGAILRVLEDQDAVMVRELEARLSDRLGGGLPYGIDPHLLTQARQRLLGQREIDVTRAVAKGNAGPVQTFHLPIARGKATKINKASARKRALHSRYMSWATGTQRHPRGLIGPAGEDVVHRTLLDLAPTGFQLVRPEGGDVDQLLGQQIEGGSLDNAVYLTVLDRKGRPSTVLLPIEVKNIREWIYDEAPELHSLLYKAAKLQLDNPDVPMMPVLVCRQRQENARLLGMLLGFYTIQARRQFLQQSADVKETALGEVRWELGFIDLVTNPEPPGTLVKAFDFSVRRDAQKHASRWLHFGAPLVDHYAQLRRRTISRRDRNEAMTDFLTEVLEVVAEDTETDEQQIKLQDRLDSFQKFE